jgi:hypothetical protein
VLRCDPFRATRAPSTIGLWATRGAQSVSLRPSMRRGGTGQSGLVGLHARDRLDGETSDFEPATDGINEVAGGGLGVCFTADDGALFCSGVQTSDKAFSVWAMVDPTYLNAVVGPTAPSAWDRTPSRILVHGAN